MNTAIIAVKETTELLRDFKTILVALLVPLILFPLTFAMITAVDAGRPSQTLEAGTASLPEELLAILRESEGLTVQALDHGETAGAISGAEADVVLIGEQTDSDGSGTTVRLIYDSSRRDSVSARALVTAVIEEYEQQRRRAVLRSSGYEPALTVSERDTGPGPDVALTATLLPLLLLVACAISPMPSAADLGAGEKERATLSPLLATGASRGSILTGKLIAVSVLGLAGAASFVMGALISQWLMPDLMGGASLAFGGGLAALRVVAQAILLTLMFSSLELTISLFADSPKEAQTYLIPIIMIALSAGYLATTVELSALPRIAWAVPVFGNALAVRAAALGGPSWQTEVLNLLASVTSAGASALIGHRLLQSEKILLR